MFLEHEIYQTEFNILLNEPWTGSVFSFSNHLCLQKSKHTDEVHLKSTLIKHNSPPKVRHENKMSSTWGCYSGLMTRALDYTSIVFTYFIKYSCLLLHISTSIEGKQQPITQWLPGSLTDQRRNSRSMNGWQLKCDTCLYVSGMDIPYVMVIEKSKSKMTSCLQFNLIWACLEILERMPVRKGVGRVRRRAF